MKKTISLAMTLALLALAACGGSPGSAPEADPASEEPVTILIAAAASLEYCLRDRLIPLFREKHPEIAVEGSYDSSGKLQTQIEEGLEADLFFSAAAKQMDALYSKGLMDSDSITPLLENRIVLITAAEGGPPELSFENIGSAESIALGDPESVPAGQYAREALTSLGLWESIQPKVSLGTNVTEVLNWVAEGSAGVGIVYATDAAATPKVTVLAEAPQGSLAAPVVYPVGITAASQKKEAARLFLDFLQSDEAMAVFQEYGFTAA